MEESEKTIYVIDDRLSFRQCSLFHGKSTSHGNCTCFAETEENWKRYYYCIQEGIHLHCTKHPEIELEYSSQNFGLHLLRCPKCNKEFEIDNLDKVIKKCLRMLNIKELKGAKLIRINDWYVPEVKKKEKISSNYWIETDVKTDKDGDTIIVIYVGHTDSNAKAQFFIKPEKLQLTSDHKDLDPATILSKIEVTLKDRTLSQNYDSLL